MKSIIVGTAGHIDHGKTALVKALTGIDADRLDEEKRRGITIDIGFAHADLEGPGGETIRVSFIDVPGHERFIKNMLAGIGGIDLVLLVIAADESIKPQTREHFDICRLLSVKRGITVLTKSDLVDKDSLEVVRLEVEEFVSKSFLESPHSPIVAVSAMTGAGLQELKTQLARFALDVPKRFSSAYPRLPIDRAFSMKGFGTVATGTLISGTIHSEDELEIFPQQKKVRVRGVQVNGEEVNEAVAGQRTALNLAGISVKELGRGMTLSSGATFQATKRLDVSLSLLKLAQPLKPCTRVRFHCYTMETSAEVILYSKTSPTPGKDAYARVRLAAPILTLPGDRFILRQFSPAATIGGGVVLDNSPAARMNKALAHMKYLRTLETGSPGAALEARVFATETRGISLDEIVAQTGWTTGEIKVLAAKLPEVTQIEDVLMGKPALEPLRKRVISALDAFHKSNPLVPGMSKEELGGYLKIHSPIVYEWLIEEGVKTKQIEIAGDMLRLANHGIVMKDEEAESKRIIETAFSSAGLKVPALKDVLAELRIDRTRAQKIVTLLLRDKTLVKISEDLVFHTNALQSLKQSIAQEKIKSQQMDVTRFKDLTGVSRKYAIPLLEYLDREHVTRRVGDERIIL